MWQRVKLRISQVTASAIAFKAVGGQGINLARLLANNTAISIFLLEDRVWRLFYVSFFAAIASAVIAASFWW